MKSIILNLIVLLSIPTIGLSQETNNSISVLGGFEYQDAETNGWNIELNYNRQLNSSRFYTEFGLNYSILEYNRPNRVELYDGCGPYPQIAFGSILNPVNGYYYNSTVQYEKQQFIRLQAGINYRFLDNPKLKLSGGVNFVNQVLVGKYRHGQFVVRPADCQDSLSTNRGTYSNKAYYGADKLSIQLQPHVDFAVQLSEKVQLKSRLSYYWQVQPSIEHFSVQLNVGLSYQWSTKTSAFE